MQARDRHQMNRSGPSEHLPLFTGHVSSVANRQALKHAEHVRIRRGGLHTHCNPRTCPIDYKAFRNAQALVTRIVFDVAGCPNSLGE
jgi:hypothetical protein